jgi:hypothetical protein
MSSVIARWIKEGIARGDFPPDDELVKPLTYPDALCAAGTDPRFVSGDHLYALSNLYEDMVADAVISLGTLCKDFFLEAIAVSRYERYDWVIGPTVKWKVDMIDEIHKIFESGDDDLKLSKIRSLLRANSQRCFDILQCFNGSLRFIAPEGYALRSASRTPKYDKWLLEHDTKPIVKMHVWYLIPLGPIGPI